MAEEKMQAAKVLLKNPYRQVILQDYNKTLESHKFRKKAEEIENEHLCIARLAPTSLARNRRLFIS